MCGSILTSLHTSMVCTEITLILRYHTDENIKCKRIRNIFFTDAGIQNLLPDLEEKKTILASQKKKQNNDTKCTGIKV